MACVLTMPATESPFCVSVHVTRVAPCESMPIPVHEPVKVVTVAGGGGVGGAGGTGAGALGVVELHAAAIRINAIVDHTRANGDMRSFYARDARLKANARLKPSRSICL